jgi:SOS response regulatory protein OraA/RecX
MMGCSSIGLKLTQHLQQKIGEDLLLDENSPKAKAQQILTSIGFDDTVFLFLRFYI